MPAVGIKKGGKEGEIGWIQDGERVYDVEVDFPVATDCNEEVGVAKEKENPLRLPELEKVELPAFQ